MFRSDSPVTSRAAAKKIIPILSRTQARVLDAYVRLGRMTAKECDDLPEFSEFGFSTIRKRVSELAKLGRLVATGVERNGCHEYEAVPR